MGERKTSLLPAAMAACRRACRCSLAACSRRSASSSLSSSLLLYSLLLSCSQITADDVKLAVIEVTQGAQQN